MKSHSKSRLSRSRSEKVLSFERLEARELLAADLRREHIPGEVVIQFKPSATVNQRAQVRAAVQGQLAEVIHTRTMQDFGVGKMERVKVSQTLGISRAIDALQRNPLVAFAEPNYVYRPAALSNDTYYTNGSLWGMYSDDAAGAIGPSGTTNQYGSQAERAWNDNITGSSNVFVGIIDEGLQFSHPDLAQNIWTNTFDPVDGVDNDGNGYIDDIHGWDFFYNNNSVYDAGEDAHGTHVAGTIGGVGGNGAGVAGVNWNVTMISAKFLGPGGGSTTDAVKAVDYITDLKTRHGLNLVATNNSWGGGGYSQSLHDAIIRSAKQDILFVAAAGNASANNDAGSYYPSSYNTSIGTSTQTAASYDGVISVASITNTGALSSFSSYGATTVDIGAPGSGVWSSVPTNSYASYNGTSMATPHVTGSLALYASVQPERPSGAALKAAILNSATPTDSLAGKTVTGGRLNVYEALKQSAFLSLDRDVYGIPGTAGLSVRHAAANISALMADTVQVSVRSTTETTPETVVLTETGVNTGLFTGSIALNSDAPAINGTLQVAHGDQITATYAALNQTVTALVDSVAPTISNVTATPRASSAEVRWTTNELASGEVRYGTSAGSLIQTATVTAQATSQLAVIVGLTPQTTYYYQVISRDAAGNESSSAVSSFTTLNAAPILFVDDDQGATYERFFKAALDANAYVYDIWDAQSIGRTPSASDLALYRRVIWNTGYDYLAATAGISSTEEAAIQSYLNGGGRIFISGQDVLYNGVSAGFQTGYLKVASYANDVTTANHTETGMPGNAISNGMSLALAKPSDFPTLYVDGITPVAGAEAMFRHSVANSAFGYSAVSYRGDYSNGGFGVVFMTFPFEAISSSAADPNNQKFVMKKVMDYLDVGGTASKFVYTNPASYATTEGVTTISFGLKLASAPTADVTIAVSSSDTTEGTVNKTSLTFTPANWNTTQTVTVTGVNDAVDDGNIPYTILLGAASSTDSNYSGADPVDLFLTNQDNDTAGVTVSTPSSTTTSEAGTTASFTIKLNSEPTANVTIPISSSDTTEGTVSPASLTFTAANWNTPQTVVVTGVNDNLDDGDIAYSAVIGALTSSDSLYNAVNPADISLTNIDNDTAGITVSSPSSTTTTEAGGTVTFTVRLDSQPTGSVTIPISSSDTTEGTVSASSLTFTTANWNVLQTVTVTGVNDHVDDGDIPYSVVIGAASSSDLLYNGMNPADINLTNVDNDTAGITVSSPSSTTTTEAGVAVTFTVRLDSEPTANVTVSVVSSDASEGTVSPTTLTFTAANWNVTQTVTVTGVEDRVDDGDIAYSVVIDAATSSDPSYNGRNPADINLTNVDDDTAGIFVSALSGSTTTEAGDAVTFTVHLNSEPTADVVVALSSSDTSEASVSHSSLTFTSANWNVAQTVTVTGLDDSLLDGDVGYSVAISSATSSDAKYNGMDPADPSLINLDNDVSGIVVSDPSASSTTEAGASVTFTVRLTTQPTADVVIPINSSDTSEGSVTPVSLTFTAANWNTVQTVTVTGVDDAMDDGDVTYLVQLGSASSLDPIYHGLDPADVSLVNTDDDTAGITVGSPSGTVTTEAGGSVTFTIRLNSEPLANVEIPLSSSDLTEGSISPALLIFTAANWSTPQTVTVSGVNDAVDDGNVAYSAVIGKAISTDTTYDVIDPADLALSNTDDDTAGISVSAPSGTSTTEAGGAVTFSVVLTSEPTANVTIPINSSNTAEGSVSAASLVFTAANWNTPQTVTVTGVDDTVVDGNKAYTVVIGVSSSTDSSYNGINPADISLTNIDNDTLPPTKFFVVNDGAPDRTFEYDKDGNSIENYTINAGNTAPRGIVSSTDGTKIWVVDKNKTVYVYNNSGGLTASWPAGSLGSTATVEGIATDGTNIWIVDSKADRVYYYAGAASQGTTSTAVLATGNFPLGSGNTNPTDLVYGKDSVGNGTIWVVNDASTDKVFRYSVNKDTGGISLVTSWNLNTNNKAPTGITLDPGATSGDLWIVDNGSTKRVFKYTEARAVTSTTSPTSSVVFNLNTANTSPQGIADPPPAPAIDRVFSDLETALPTVSQRKLDQASDLVWSLVESRMANQRTRELTTPSTTTAQPRPASVVRLDLNEARIAHAGSSVIESSFADNSPRSSADSRRAMSVSEWVDNTDKLFADFFKNK